ncbi:MAG: hypothetical protein GX024_03030 [Clostridiales bacterium]|nr:hypothetical protein [Clostridiales bacterium]
MLQVFLYIIAIGLAGIALALLLGYRKNNYHVFLVRQFNIQENEYDRIYNNN